MLTIFGRRGISTWGGRGRGTWGFLCRNFPSCFSVSSLDVIITLSCGIPLGNPKEITKSVNFCYVVKIKKKTYHPMGRWGGATLGPFAFGDAVGFGGVTIAEDGSFVTTKDAGYLRYANVGKNRRRKRKARETDAISKQRRIGSSSSSYQSKKQREWRGGEGKKKRWRLRWRESPANKKRWGWLDENACVSKQVGQSDLICDKRAVQVPRCTSPCAQYLPRHRGSFFPKNRTQLKLREYISCPVSHPISSAQKSSSRDISRCVLLLSSSLHIRNITTQKIPE